MSEDQAGPADRPDVLARLAAEIDDPFPVLSWLRRHDPLHRLPDGAYLVSRYAAARQVLDSTGTVFRSPAPAGQPPRHRCLRRLPEMMVLKNPPEHTRLRGLVSRQFTPRRVAGMRASIERTADRLLDAIEEPLRDGETVDLHSTVSWRLPLVVLADLLGVPRADQAELAALVNLIVPATSHAAPGPELLAAADQASEQVEEYFQDLIARRRRQPRADLISDLLAVRQDEPDRLSDDELLSMVWGFWLAGFETTAAAIDHGVLAMTGHPVETRWLRRGHGPALRFAEEVLRHQAVIIFSVFGRVATRAVELDGGTVPAGSVVRVALAAANRDPAAFPDPDRFRPGRADSPVLALGHGIHFCVGAQLARTEIAVALAALATRFPGLVLAARPRRLPSPAVRVLDRLPVRLPSRAPGGELVASGITRPNR